VRRRSEEEIYDLRGGFFSYEEVLIKNEKIFKNSQKNIFPKVVYS